MRWPRAESGDLLVVCTGNVCRSPYIAARLAADLPDLAVTSAGTGALVGSPPTDQVVALLRARGVSASPAVARSLKRSHVRGAKLVLTAESRHRIEAVRMAAQVGDRVFTLLELARLIRQAGSPTGLGVDRVLALGQEALLEGEVRDHDDDLADPYGKSDEAYSRMAAAAEAALDVLVPALREGSA